MFLLKWYVGFKYWWAPSLFQSHASMHQIQAFPGSPVAKTLGFHCRGKGSIPGWGTKIPTCGTWWGQKNNLQKTKCVRLSLWFFVRVFQLLWTPSPCAGHQTALHQQTRLRDWIEEKGREPRGGWHAAFFPLTILCCIFHSTLGTKLVRTGFRSSTPHLLPWRKSFLFFFLAQFWWTLICQGLKWLLWPQNEPISDPKSLSATRSFK